MFINETPTGPVYANPKLNHCKKPQTPHWKPAQSTKKTRPWTQTLIPRVRIRLPEAMRHGDGLAVAELAQVVALDPKAMKAELLALKHAH